LPVIHAFLLQAPHRRHTHMPRQSSQITLWLSW
jgi:hypothetical protein